MPACLRQNLGGWRLAYDDRCRTELVRAWRAWSSSKVDVVERNKAPPTDKILVMHAANGNSDTWDEDCEREQAACKRDARQWNEDEAVYDLAQDSRNSEVEQNEPPKFRAAGTAIKSHVFFSQNGFYGINEIHNRSPHM